MPRSPSGSSRKSQLQRTASNVVFRKRRAAQLDKQVDVSRPITPKNWAQGLHRSSFTLAANSISKVFEARSLSWNRSSFLLSINMPLAPDLRTLPAMNGYFVSIGRRPAIIIKTCPLLVRPPLLPMARSPPHSLPQTSCDRPSSNTPFRLTNKGIRLTCH